MQMPGAGAAVGNYHNIVSQSLSLLSLFLSLSLSVFIVLQPIGQNRKRCRPRNAHFKCARLDREGGSGGKELGSFQSRGIGIGIGYVQLLELPCTYLHWATTVN